MAWRAARQVHTPLLSKSLLLVIVAPESGCYPARSRRKQDMMFVAWLQRSMYIHPYAVQSTTSPVVIGHAASLTYIGETMTCTEYMYNTNQYRDGGGSQQPKSFLEPCRNAGCKTQRFS